MPAARQESRDGRITFERDKRRCVLDVAVLHAIAFDDPAARQSGSGRIGERFEDCVGFAVLLARGLPFRGEFAPEFGGVFIADHLRRVGLAAECEPEAPQHMLRAILVVERDGPLAAMRQLDGRGESEARGVVPDLR